ncbi:MAG: beta-lactamase family protein, partial [candidate division WOR-3 bacterium]
MKHVRTLCFALLFLCSSVYAQRPDSAYLDSFFLYRMDSLHLPGLAASIVKDGQIIWTGAYGWAKIEDSIPATDTTIWNQGSISKTITAVAAMNAWEEDLFDLDTNINDLLPFNVIHHYYPDDTISPRNILVHNSCVEDRWNLWDSLVVWGEDSPVPLDTFMYNYFNPNGYWYHPYNFLPYPPGSHWEYSNVGNSLVGYLTEAVTDDSFPLYCQQHIFDPLGMTRTSWFYSNLNMNNVAMPYAYSGGQYVPEGYPSTCIYPSSTLKSSILDLTRFLLMFMQYGELDSVRILDSTTVALMRTIQDTTYTPNWYIGITWWYGLSQFSGR